MGRLWSGLPVVLFCETSPFTPAPTVALVFAKRRSAPGVPAQSSRARLCGVGCLGWVILPRQDGTHYGSGRTSPGVPGLPNKVRKSGVGCVGWVFWVGLPGRSLFLAASARPVFFCRFSAGAGSPFAGRHYCAQTFRLFSNDFPFAFSFSAGAVSFSDRCGSGPPFLPSPRRGAFSFWPLLARPANVRFPIKKLSPCTTWVG